MKRNKARMLPTDAGIQAPRLRFYCDDQRHLVCVPYSIANLHRMAAELGIHRCWFHAAARFAHYDIPKQRIAEIQAKCLIVTPRVVLRICKGGAPEAPHASADGEDTLC